MEALLLPEILFIVLAILGVDSGQEEELALGYRWDWLLRALEALGLGLQAGARLGRVFGVVDIAIHMR